MFKAFWQALINLVRNAVEATPGDGPPVLLSAVPAPGQVAFEVLDTGSDVMIIVPVTAMP